MLPDLAFRITARGAYAREFAALRSDVAGLDQGLSTLNRTAQITALTIGAFGKAFLAGLSTRAIVALGRETVKVFHDAAEGVSDFGGVVDRDLLQNMRTIDQFFTDLGNSIYEKFGQAVIRTANAVFEFSQMLKPVAEQDSISALTKELDGLTKSRDNLLADKNLVTGGLSAILFGPGGELANLNAQIDAVTARLQHLKDVRDTFGARMNDYFATPFDAAGPFNPNILQNQDKERADAERARLARIGERGAAIKSVNAALDDQIAKLGMSAEQEEIYDQLQAAGTTITTAAGQAIAAKVHTISAYTQALAEANARIQTFQSLAGGFLSTFTSEIQQGKSLAESFRGAWVHVLQDVIQKIEEASIAAAASKLFGVGGAATGLLGGIGQFFGLPFATGGQFTVGGSGGPDSQFVPLALTPGEVVSIDRGDRRRGGDGPLQVVVHVQANDYFDARVERVSSPVAQRAAVGAVTAYDKASRRSRELNA